MSCVVLLSGGIDSGVIYREVLAECRDVYPIWVHYGQAAAKREKSYANGIAGEVVHTAWVINLAKAKGTVGPESVVPGRNAALLALGASYAQELGATSVLIGCNADDATHYPDCRPQFIRAMNEACSYAYGVSVAAPLIESTKAEIIGRAKACGLVEWWSCYLGGENPCGECEACKAFE